MKPIVTFYNCDPKDAPKTTQPAHLGANAILTCQGKLLLEKRRDSDIWGLVGGGCKKWETGREAIAWIREGASRGAGEIVVNSIDTDGVKGGFDIEMLKAVSDVVTIPVIASGGAGSIADFVTLFREIPSMDAGLAASIFHFGEVQIKDLKNTLRAEGVNVRI